MKESKMLLLIDGHALIYRSYHAFPELSTSEGLLVNAVYGFVRTILTAIRDFEPEYIAVAFDLPQPTFRHKAFEAYKAHRAEMPDDLKPQIQIVKDFVTALNMPQFALAGYEADDVIGTLATLVETEKKLGDVRTLILTGDKDSLQLVSEKTRVFIPGRGKFSKDVEYTPEKVVEVMGVRPDQIVDLKALMGDTSDNIPGVKGIGKLTATKLIQRFESVEELYAFVDTGKDDPLLKPAVRAKLIEGRESAVLSQSLATIDRSVPLELELEKCRIRSYDKDAAAALLEEFEFKSLVSLLPPDEFESGVQTALF